MQRSSAHKLVVVLGLAIATGLLSALIPIQSVTTLANIPSLLTKELQYGTSSLPAFTLSLYPLKSHPLPQTLAKWQDPTNSGDYFSQVKPTEVGYLIWSQFPIKVYIEQSAAVSQTDKAQTWVKAVFQAVQEWSVYLPLEVVEQPETADITIVLITPPLRRSNQRQSVNLSRARSAETRYELYINNRSNSTDVLSHQCTILLSSNQTTEYIQASARHELGHALGIWGHSPVATDALYFSQVRNPPSISPRDLNTLKRVYQQPTRLGSQEKGSRE